MADNGQGGAQNTPTPVPQAPVPPAGKTPGKAPEKKDDKKLKPKTGLLLSFIGLFLFLFALFMVFLVVMLLQGGGNNPILQALGVEPALLKDLLQTLVSLVFGFLSLVSFIVLLIALFRRFTAAKIEVEKKKSSLILSIASGLFFAFSVFLWITLFFYISRIEVGGAGAAVILSEPDNTINLTAPISITFDAQQLERLYLREGIVSYSWDLDSDGEFDDGNGRAIQYEYTSRGNAEGIYNVAVKILLGDGKEVVTEKLVTIANVLPKPVIEYSPQILEVPVEVAFDASSSRDPDGNIISYEWDFDGDGGVDAQGQEVTFEFTEVVQQEITLTVTDNNGESAEEKLLLDFRRGRTQQAVIVARPGLSGQVPFSVFFDGSSSFLSERIQSYEWDFGDGSALVRGRSAQHTYAEAGEYTVRLEIQGASGERMTKEETVIVERRTNTPLAVISVLDQEVGVGGLEGQAPYEVTFDASESNDLDGSIVEYRWDFDGDGVTDAVGEEVGHTFVQTGSFVVQLTVVDDDDLTGVAELPVEISVPEVQVALEVSSFSGPVPLEVTFDATGSRAETGKIISYNWDFGDDSPPVIGSARQTHVFSEVGEYTVLVSVLTDEGKRGEKDVIVVAREVELQADFTVNPTEPKAEAKVFFDASSSQGQISRYYWEFGDGTISRVVKPDHIYSEPGTYEVKLEVYDRKNRVSRKETTVDISSP